MGILKRGRRRGQRRVMPDGTLGLVEIEPMPYTFTMKCGEQFYRDLENVMENTPGIWSYSSILRKLVADAAGTPVVEQVKSPKTGKVQEVVTSGTQEQVEAMKSWKKELSQRMEKVVASGVSMGTNAADWLAWEILQGRIDHAIAFGYTEPAEDKCVFPASKTDGDSKLLYAIPEGARLQLDPSLTEADFDQMDLIGPGRSSPGRCRSMA